MQSVIDDSVHCYEGRPPQSNWWRKQLLMTAGQFTVIYFTRHHSDCHPGVNCGKILFNRHHKSVEERLEFGFGGQLPHSGRPHDRTTRFCPPLTTVVSPESLPHCAGLFQCLPEETFLSRLQNFVKISKELWMQSFKNRYVHKNTDRQTETTDLRVYPMHWIDKNKTT